MIVQFQRVLRRYLKANPDVNFPLDINVIKLEYLSAIAKAQPHIAHKKLLKLECLFKQENLKNACTTLIKNITIHSHSKLTTSIKQITFDFRQG